MKINKKIFSIVFTLLILTGCKNQKENIESTEKNGWKTESQVIKTIKNINFTFPSKGMSFEQKENYVSACFKALEENVKIIDLENLNDTINIRFLNTRKESEKYTGQASSGSAWPHIKTLYVVVNENVKPPIKHELMHLIAMLEWSDANQTSTWINEGLATYAENNCNDYNVAQIYRFFMETDKLIAIELLAKDFYKQPEMIGYHQSAYIVEFILKNYGVIKLKKLWIEGFDKFEEIYNVPYAKIKVDLEKELLEKYPKTPEINWEVFEEGCN
ncbi:MAG: hypothetical protein AB8B78_15325 [Polaribacter sp.]